jgi:hypothetical protein
VSELTQIKLGGITMNKIKYDEVEVLTKEVIAFTWFCQSCHIQRKEELLKSGELPNSKTVFCECGKVDQLVEFPNGDKEVLKGMGRTFNQYADNKMGIKSRYEK